MSNTKRTKNRKLFYKSLLRLRVNPLNNNKFLKLTDYEVPKQVSKKVGNKTVYETLYLKRYKEIGKFKKKKMGNIYSKIRKI